MSHTNKTQYYNLPQFIGTDVPAWLTDVNQGYAAIDAGMRAAQVKADNADQTAGQAANDVQALSSTVTTQASQISAAAQAASSAQTTANGADAKAYTNAQAIDGLDARVTALEQGGGGTTIESETITMANEAFKAIPEHTGKRAVFACIDSTSVTGAFPVIGYSNTLAAQVVYVGTISATGCALKTGNHTVTVFYV